MTRRGSVFHSVPLRCPSCRPFASRVERPGGGKFNWSPEAIYVGFLQTVPYTGYKKAPAQCPECGSTLEVLKEA